MVHLEGSIQVTVIHSLAYFINAALVYLFYSYTHIVPSAAFLLYILALIGADVYAFLNLNVVYYVVTQAAIFISFLVYYFRAMPKFIQTSVYQIVFFSAAIILLFLNEVYHCKKMLEMADLPYHILVEFFGVALFYIISSNFSKL